MPPARLRAAFQQSFYDLYYLPLPGSPVLGGLAILKTAFISQRAAFLSLGFALRRSTVFIHFFFDEACGFLDLTFNSSLTKPAASLI